MKYSKDTFMFPKGDVVALPIKSTSMEDLAKYLLEELVAELKKQNMLLPIMHDVSVTVEESYQQRC